MSLSPHAIWQVCRYVLWANCKGENLCLWEIGGNGVYSGGHESEDASFHTCQAVQPLPWFTHDTTGESVLLWRDIYSSVPISWRVICSEFKGRPSRKSIHTRSMVAKDSHNRNWQQHLSTWHGNERCTSWFTKNSSTMPVQPTPHHAWDLLHCLLDRHNIQGN